MANAGFNAATDIFSMGAKWKVKNSSLNGSVSTAECPNRYNDVTHRDQYGEKIAPTATYECVDDVDELPDIGSIVTIDSKKVAIQKIVVTTAKGAAPTADVTGVQVQSGATEVRTYSCGTVAISPRHRAQDVTGDLGNSTPDTLTGATFTFEANVQPSEPKGEIVNHDVSNGRYEAAYTFTSGTGTPPSAPTVSGSKVVSGPVTPVHPENDYVTYSLSVTDSLTGTDAS